MRPTSADDFTNDCLFNRKQEVSGSPSSSGLGHCPFTAVTGVRLPLGTPIAGIAQLVEHDLAKVGVASSSLVSRSIFSC